VICAGQVSNRALADEICGLPVHVVGGAHLASELDAKRAIDQATRMAAII
jgi:2,4-dienoyl-CoA reductase (NADPH2)